MARRAGEEFGADRAHDAACAAAYARTRRCRRGERVVDLRLDAAACRFGSVWCGEGSADLRYRTLGVGIRAAWRAGEHRVARLDPGRGQWLGSLPPRQPGEL